MTFGMSSKGQFIKNSFVSPIILLALI